MNTNKENNQVNNNLVIDWASALPRRPGQPPRRITQPVAHYATKAPPAARPPLDELALDPSETRPTKNKRPPPGGRISTWTVIKAGLILAALITFAPPLLRVLSFVALAAMTYIYQVNT